MIIVTHAHLILLPLQYTGFFFCLGNSISADRLNLLLSSACSLCFSCTNSLFD